MPPYAREIFGAFLRLGLTSFGGPIAHIGYFRREFVERRRWLEDAQFAQLLAIAQFLPGPASSQLGFGIGLLRGGALGATAAFVAFTLPSALLVVALASLRDALSPVVGGVALHALKLVAAIVVVDGLARMAKSLTPDLPRIAIAIATALSVSLAGGAWAQLAAIVLAAGLGATLLGRVPVPAPSSMALPVSRSTSVALLALFALGLVAALAYPTTDASLRTLAAAMWRAGSLVFGGGHVVLPLLEESTVASGWLSREAFLAGYGAAQLVPGPMFSLAAYLGALTPTGAASWLAALVALLAVFVPGFLLLAALLPVWDRVTAHPAALRAVAGVNAAVVGLLAAALINPVLPAALTSRWDLVVLGVGLVLQRRLQRPTVAVLALAIIGAVWTT